MYYHVKNAPPLQTPGHPWVAVAYLSSESDR